MNFWEFHRLTGIFVDQTEPLCHSPVNGRFMQRFNSPDVFIYVAD